MRLRFDFPPEVVEERAATYERIVNLLAKQTYEAAREANALHLEWLRRYPEDGIALDAGEVISKTVSAYECEEPQAAPEEAARNPIATT